MGGIMRNNAHVRRQVLRDQSPERAKAQKADSFDFSSGEGRWHRKFLWAAMPGACLDDQPPERSGCARVCARRYVDGA